jgi:hypothetical protein
MLELHQVETCLNCCYVEILLRKTGIKRPKIALNVFFVFFKILAATFVLH